MKFIFSRYRPHYIYALLYMLQVSEYKAFDYLSWFLRTSDFNSVAYRQKLTQTRKIIVLRSLLWVITLLVSVLAVILIPSYPWISILLLILLPWILAISIVPFVWVGYVLIQKPREKQLVAKAKRVLQNHNGIKIAIVGSYGKTTAKEALLAGLSQAKKVAATPGNQNTVLGISRFAQTLSGDEEVLIFELGESHVGDIKQLSELVGPDIGIITGINEAHLKTFKTIDRTVATIFELRDYLGEKPLYKNIESELVAAEVAANDSLSFNRSGVAGWRVTNAQSDIHGTTFKLNKADSTINIHVGLLGLHNVGIISAVAALSKDLGATNEQIQKGLSALQPVEHRMQPKQVHGAWVIDDTYNGNKEGVEAGLKLLGSLKARKRIYITPGLVEQGSSSSEIHQNMGRQIAAVADEVVLMKNSTTADIKAGLKDAKYVGKLSIIDDPLAFYTNLDQFVARGDVILMQNDWTDNYH